MDTPNGYLFAPNVEFNDLDLSNFLSVVDAFSQRIDGWFFEPINLLIGNECNLFVITAIECMVVDALSGFWSGADSTGATFTEFLTEKMNIDPSVATAFYTRFRNGIIHQTNIKMKSVISNKVKSFQFDKSGILFFNPIEFYTQLRIYFNEYLEELRSRGSGVQRFKKRFKKLFKDEFNDQEWRKWEFS